MGNVEHIGKYRTTQACKILVGKSQKQGKYCTECKVDCVELVQDSVSGMLLSTW